MKRASLLWVDLEMTGLEPENDKILEIAAIATAWDLEPICSYQGIVKVDEKLIKERMIGEFWERNQEAKRGLIEQNKNGKSARQIEMELMDFLNNNFKKEVYLAGNSIHQDRKFIEREMPELNKRLHYRMLDVSAWKVYFENACGIKFVKPDRHRAMSDILGSIDELKYYLTMVKNGQ